MSTSVKRVKITPWTPRELKKQLKEVTSTLTQVSAGLKTITGDPSYVARTKSLASEILDDIARFEELYAATLGEMAIKREDKPKPRLCDIALTDFLSNKYAVSLPTMGMYGICDVNTLAFKAISLYLNENGLTQSQFFKLDNELQTLFNSPSVNDPTKTYLDLSKERIAELTSKRANTGTAVTSAAAEIIDNNGTITMNHSALKIVLSRFVVDYELEDVDQYIPAMEDFNQVLKERSSELSK